MNRIVVGVDGSEGSALALRWALRESRLRGWPVTAVMAWGFLDQHFPGSGFLPDYGEAEAVAALRRCIVDTVGADVADSIDLRAPCDLPATALLAEAEDASLLVVGARGLGGFRELLLGSVSQNVLHHAPCTVAIVRDGSEARMGAAASEGTAERIVVGVDGSPTGQEALRWAYEEARLHRSAVEIVHAWQITALATDGLGTGAPSDWAWLEQASRETLDAAIAQQDASGLPEEPIAALVQDSAASAILDASKDADLVVVGSRGFGGFSGLLFGSVSHQVARHATVPVVIVPRGAE